MLEHTNAGDRWIPEDEYRVICSRVPILCVDLLPVIKGTDTFGLIERDTYGGGRGLCLVGGAVLLDEPLHEAVERHVLATLGADACLERESVVLVDIYQYYVEARPGQLHDPRKNAVAVTYTGVLSGALEAAGEAHALHTFTLDKPPALQAFGFGQGRVVCEALAALRASPTRGPTHGGGAAVDSG
jgi:ADP-ribose pyrophosphatase YjhB (NUDIX family)